VSRLTSLVVGAGLLLVTGCQQPSPSITLVSSGHSTHFAAQQWCRGGKVLLHGNECPGTGPQLLKIVRANGGDQVGIDVDSSLADAGWYVFNTETSEPVIGISHSHYRTFTVDYSRSKVPGIAQLEVRTVDHIPTNDTDVVKVTGQWVFQVAAKTD
jgi:hypothetical protein